MIMLFIFLKVDNINFGLKKPKFIFRIAKKICEDNRKKLFSEQLLSNKLFSIQYQRFFLKTKKIQLSKQIIFFEASLPNQ